MTWEFLLPAEISSGAAGGSSGLWVVSLVAILIWIGIFFFLLLLDKRLRRLEREARERKG